MSEQRLYGERAELYDSIYHWKDYAAESARLGGLLGKLGIADGGRILEAACGTGSHLVHLRDHYQVSGFDLSDAMLSLARSKLPAEVELFRADMTNFAVPVPFDALFCLFSSIGYAHPEAKLRATAGSFARAVRPGGALIVEPWLTPEAYQPGRSTMQTYDGEDLKLCRASISKQEGEMAVLDFHWLVLRRGASEVEHFVERHELWLCSTELMQAIFEEAGFDTRIEEDGLQSKRRLLIGQRRA
jgi:daunosaminyl-N,N-dimethyltransferase/N-dimethyltransferase